MTPVSYAQAAGVKESPVLPHHIRLLSLYIMIIVNQRSLLIRISMCRLMDGLFVLLVSFPKKLSSACCWVHRPRHSLLSFLLPESGLTCLACGSSIL